LVVFTSDHGDFASKYGIIGKSWCQDDVLIRVPLIISHPACRTEPSVSDALVETIDILPTLLQFAELSASSTLHGSPLTPILRGDISTGKNAVFAYDKAEYSQDHLYRSMIRTGHWKLVQSGNGITELYNLADDPHESRNLAGQPAYHDLITDLQIRLLNWHIEYAGGFVDSSRVRYWEDETCFYDKTVFTGDRVRAPRYNSADDDPGVV